MAKLKIGIQDLSSPGWTAGGVYTEVVLRALALPEVSDRFEIVLLSSQKEPKIPAGSSARAIRMPDEVSPLLLETIVQSEGLSVVFPMIGPALAKVEVGKMAWIPDFQHLHLPEYFLPQEIENRSRLYREIADLADAVILSSDSAKADFIRFAPDAAAKARVCRFPSLLAFSDAEKADSSEIRTLYGIPPKFAIVPNQFWKHKNHLTTIRALKLLKNRGITVPLVMTGGLTDYRDASGTYLSNLLQEIAKLGLSQQVQILGLIPHAHLLELLRESSLVLQPSLFEGWSTTIQDTLALGRPLIVSKLPVHQEQVPHALGFFEALSAEELAAGVAEQWERLEPGPDRKKERVGKSRAREQAADFALHLGTVFEEVAAIHRHRKSLPLQPPAEPPAWTLEDSEKDRADRLAIIDYWKSEHALLALQVADLKRTPTQVAINFLRRCFWSLRGPK